MFHRIHGIYVTCTFHSSADFFEESLGIYWQPLAQFGGSESSGAGGGFSFGGSQPLQPPASGFTFGLAAGQTAPAAATPAQVSPRSILKI